LGIHMRAEKEEIEELVKPRAHAESSNGFLNLLCVCLRALVCQWLQFSAVM
jgi:hypothetical protein